MVITVFAVFVRKFSFSGNRKKRTYLTEVLSNFWHLGGVAPIPPKSAYDGVPLSAALGR